MHCKGKKGTFHDLDHEVIQQVCSADLQDLGRKKLLLNREACRARVKERGGRREEGAMVELGGVQSEG